MSTSNILTPDPNDPISNISTHNPNDPTSNIPTHNPNDSASNIFTHNSNNKTKWCSHCKKFKLVNEFIRFSENNIKEFALCNN
ncbi:23053_t:CDS:1, partial [Racocetra persica]